MPTKTERILSYLPSTFKSQPQPNATYSVVDAYGHELLLAENSLAAVMQAHWVDHADRNATDIVDLAQLGALYGLAPREDESVEEFREHLKRYIRTFLEGTVTVQGLLRVTAETLGLNIADDYEDIDTWWTRDSDDLITVIRPTKDAAKAIFGFESAEARGLDAQYARFRGNVDLSTGITIDDSAHILRILVDEDGPFEVDLLKNSVAPIDLTGAQIAKQIKEQTGHSIAHFDGTFLTISSTTLGPGGSLQFEDSAADAAELLLGLRPHLYTGRSPQPAMVTGQADLSGLLDLTDNRYLRLRIDGTDRAEIDCLKVGDSPDSTTLANVVQAINDTVGYALASHENNNLILSSATVGFTSSIEFQRAAAQDARSFLFGEVPTFNVGRDATAARVTGTPDHSEGINLSEESLLQLRVDGKISLIDCAGADPVDTQLAEIVTAINEGVGETIAAHNGRQLVLTAPSTGPESEIVFQTPPERDATERIFGIGPRRFDGEPATPARIVGELDLTAERADGSGKTGVNLGAQRLLQLAVDNNAPLVIDFRAALGFREEVSADEIVDVINDEVGEKVAASDGERIIVTSPLRGSASRVQIIPTEEQQRRRFVSSAIVTDEATRAIFDVDQAEAKGSGATHARIAGTLNLSRGVDLSQDRYLRLSVDGKSGIDIDCAGIRPRATLAPEVISAINSALGITSDVASYNGKNLILTSPSLGAQSQIVIEPPRAEDALDLLLGIKPQLATGQNAVQVAFVGLVDLSRHANLSVAAQIKIAIDGAPPIEIDCAANAADPTAVQLNEIVVAINLAIGSNVASHDGQLLRITSPTSGETSRLEFLTPNEGDATEILFGIVAPRIYHGRAAQPARLIGTRPVAETTDLRIQRFLRIAIGTNAPVDIDCSSAASAPNAENLDPKSVVTREQIQAALENIAGINARFTDRNALVIETEAKGNSARLRFDHYTASDATAALLGAANTNSTGIDAQPAQIVGNLDLLAPVDLTERSKIRLAVDDQRPVDIDLAGVSPLTTFLDEMIDGINHVYSGLASRTDDDHIVLTSPTVGERSQLQLLPLRTIEVVEYPPTPMETAIQQVVHGDQWSVTNDGAGEVVAEATIFSTQGVSEPTLVNMTLGWQARLMVSLSPGESARLWQDETGDLQAYIQNREGVKRDIPGNRIIVGPVGSKVFVPFTEVRSLRGDEDESPSIQLNNPLAPNLLQLNARDGVITERSVDIKVDYAQLTRDGEPLPSAFIANFECKGRVEQRDSGIFLIQQSKNENGQIGSQIALQLEGESRYPLDAYIGHSVLVTGTFHPYGEESADALSDGSLAQPLVVSKSIVALFDVEVRHENREGETTEERYEAVSIGHDVARADSLTRQILARSSRLVRVDSWAKGSILNLPQGRSQWRYLDCYGSRFNQANFFSRGSGVGKSRFAGGLCLDRGIFNISRFANDPPDEPIAAVFASSQQINEPPVFVSLTAVHYQPGALEINLPADLPPRFGGRFNEARFGLPPDAPEIYPLAVTEPRGDDAYIEASLNGQSSLVKATVVTRVPQGWEAIPMPFRNPQPLTLGAVNEPAQIYLSEPGLRTESGEPGFLKIEARHNGTYGNEITVAARESGPAMYDFAVHFAGGRFENARAVVMGTPHTPEQVQDLLAPGPIGVLQAKAAGVQVKVTRERTPERR